MVEVVVVIIRLLMTCSFYSPTHSFPAAVVRSLELRCGFKKRIASLVQLSNLQFSVSPYSPNPTSHAQFAMQKVRGQFLKLHLAFETILPDGLLTTY